MYHSPPLLHLFLDLGYHGYVGKHLTQKEEKAWDKTEKKHGDIPTVCKNSKISD